MVKTESDAMVSFCPMRLDSGSNRLCCGSSCMAWRWSEKRMNWGFVVGSQNPKPLNVPDGWVYVPEDRDEGEPGGWMEDEASYNARRRGYCGMVGSPEPIIEISGDPL